jgi:hypothetical protein
VATSSASTASNRPIARTNGLRPIVVVATQYVHYADGTFREKIGFEPDVRVERGEDALEVAIADLSTGHT